MKPGELYKPVGFDCVLLCVGPDTFTVEAGECPFYPTPEDPTAADGEYPLTEKIHFSPTPPMHRAWHWSDLATPEQVAQNLLDEDLIEEVLISETLINKRLSLVINKTLYVYENNL